MKLTNRQKRMLKTLIETVIGGVAALLGDIIANGDMPMYVKTGIFIAVSQAATAFMNNNEGDE